MLSYTTAEDLKTSVPCKYEVIRLWEPETGAAAPSPVAKGPESKKLLLGVETQRRGPALQKSSVFLRVLTP